MTKTRLWRIHRGMIRRCYDPRSHNWAHYGGRGITLCQKWLGSFQAFHDWAMANGYRDDLTIDRIDNDGPYSPENCRWATAYEQENNRGNNHRLQLHNETKTVAEWGRDKRCRVRPSTLYGRLWRGWQPTPAILLQ